MNYNIDGICTACGEKNVIVLDEETYDEVYDKRIPQVDNYCKKCKRETMHSTEYDI